MRRSASFLHRKYITDGRQCQPLFEKSLHFFDLFGETDIRAVQKKGVLRDEKQEKP